MKKQKQQKKEKEKSRRYSGLGGSNRAHSRKTEEEAVYARPRDAASLGRLRRKESWFGRRRS